jgi:ElaB/YqjD/DUF883 family membrane-anchored ribosome-binding protein
MSPQQCVQDEAEDRAAAKHREANKLRAKLEKALEELRQRVSDADAKDSSASQQASELQQQLAACDAASALCSMAP